MSWILNIDTSLETAAVTICCDGLIQGTRKNENQKDHASFLEPAIKSLVKEAGIQLNDLSEIAVVYGPGSYTGLRVGMSSAKGLCYALNKPLILLNNLEVLTTAALRKYNEIPARWTSLFCPMIDARRMEVYTAIYDGNLNIVMNPCALILNVQSYQDFLTNSGVYFFGDGSDKWKVLCDNKNAGFINIVYKEEAINQLSTQKLEQQLFSPLAYAQPLYIKEFYSTQKP